jgi:hypothetical protein
MSDVKNDYSILNGQDVSIFYSSYTGKYLATLTLTILKSKIEKKVEGNTIEDALQKMTTWYSENLEKNKRSIKNIIKSIYKYRKV